MIDEEKLIQENIKNLNPEDIPIVSYFGSGSSLIGSILIKLGMDYIEGYQERIIPGEKQTKIVNPLWRNHWWDLNHKYRNSSQEKSLRFFKAHHYPVSFEKSPVKKVILLVRDGRDALISYYNWRKNFRNDPHTFDEFLNTDSFFKRKPFHDWALFCEEWFKWGESHDLYTITFEDLKFNGKKTMEALLNFIGVSFDSAQLNQVLIDTSFKKMRYQEDLICDQNNKARIFRKGLIGEWRDVFTSEQLSQIPELAQKWMQNFGYSKEHPSYCKPIIIVTTLEYKTTIKKLIEKLESSISIITTDEFNPKQLISMGEITIDHSQHFEISRSLNFACSHLKSRYILVPEGESGVSYIKNLLPSLVNTKSMFKNKYYTSF